MTGGVKRFMDWWMLMLLPRSPRCDMCVCVCLACFVCLYVAGEVLELSPPVCVCVCVQRVCGLVLFETLYEGLGETLLSLQHVTHT